MKILRNLRERLMVMRCMNQPIAAFSGGPPAMGPYSLGVMAEGRYVFVSGMAAYDAAVGKITRGSVGEQTRLTLKNIEGVLKAAGASKADVVSCRVYLSNLTPENFQAMNEVYADFFGETKPARATVGVQLLGFDVEIECVAVLPPG